MAQSPRRKLSGVLAASRYTASAGVESDAVTADIGRRIKRTRALTHLAMMLERLTLLFWPTALLILGFVAAAFLEVPQWLGAVSGGWLQAALLLAVAAGILITFRRGVRQMARPEEDEVRRRVEVDSGVSHRPLTGLEDTLATGGDQAAALWRIHQARLAEESRKVRAAGPRPVLAAADPFGMRAAVMLVLIVGIAAAWASPVSRLTAAVLPDLRFGPSAPPPVLDVWISPPDYTGLPPVLLTRKARGPGIDADEIAGVDTRESLLETDPEEGAVETVTVPVGSRILATVTGGDGQPSLSMEAAVAGEGASESVLFEAVGPRAHRMETVLEESAAVAIVQDGDALAQWRITVTPDLAPTAASDEEPDESERQALVLSYTVADDYAVETVRAELRRVDDDGEVMPDAPIELDLPPPGPGQTTFTGKSFHDLTPHPWAGTEVEIIIRATDDLEQTGASEPIRIVLPERVFDHPVARAIIEQRKRLTVAHEEWRDVAQVLIALAARPHRYYDDITVFLLLKSASSRLFLDKEGAADTITSVQSVLWDTALRIEDGEVSIAARDLRELQRKLEEALARDASDEELEQLIDELQAALDRYLDAMAKQMQEQMAHQGEDMEQMEIDPERMLSRQNLRDMVERAREMMRNGARDAAREMLSQLQQMMENMRAGVQPRMSPQQQAMQEMMRQLSELTRRQQELMDDTYRNQQNQAAGRDRNGGRQQLGQGRQLGQQGQRRGDMRRGREGEGSQGMNPRPGQRGANGQQGMPSADELAEMQEALRRALGDFMRKLGNGMSEIPEGFGRANQAMRNARDALRGNEPGEAVGPQGDALDELRSGAKSLAESLSQQLANGQGPGQQNAEGNQQGRDERDPLNRSRNTGGTANDSNRVGIPTESDVMRAREIFDELRRRSGDQSRPLLERQYIDRLLRRF